MAVTPIRQQLSVVPRPAAMSMPASMPPQPSQQGWVWDGSNWVWDPDCFPPQPPFQCNFPPQCPPPWWWSQCPPCPPPAPPVATPTPPLTGPIVGVTDGSSAAPGQVGEYVRAQVQFAYTASPSTTNSVQSPLVVQPGDWDLGAYMILSGAFDAASFYINPVPTGIIDGNGMSGFNQINSSASANLSQYSTVVAPGTRGSFTVPTLLAFTCQVALTTASIPAGTAYLLVHARRRR